MVRKRRKNTKYSLNLEKNGFDRKRISEIKNKQDNIVTNQICILDVLKSYFEKFCQKVSFSDVEQIDAYLEENLRRCRQIKTNPCPNQLLNRNAWPLCLKYQ